MNTILESFINDLISFNDTGMLICDKSNHIDATTSYVQDIILQKCNNQIPLYTTCMKEKIANDRLFYYQLLQETGYHNDKRENVIILRDKLTKLLFAQAYPTIYNTSVLIIKDAQNLSPQNYRWLIDIQNALNLMDTRFAVILIGNKKLLQNKQKLIAKKAEQIIARFMVRELVINESEEI